VSVVQIPFTSDRFHQKVRISLDDVFYRFELHFNDPDESWYLDLRDDADNLLVGSVRLCLNRDLFKPFKYLDVPQGQLAMFDTQREDVEPDRDNLGTRVLTVYQEE